MFIVKHRISTDEYDRMVRAGVFERGTRIELIHGELLQMTPIGTGHQSEVDRLNDLFTSRVARRAIVRVQGPIRVGRYSEPEPDVVLLERRDDYYSKAHPDPSAILLVVEVADSSLGFDREVKAPLYGGESVREYWIVNLVASVIEVHRPAAPGPGYQRTVHIRGQSLAPLAFPDLAFTVDELLGPPDAGTDGLIR